MSSKVANSRSVRWQQVALANIGSSDLTSFLWYNPVKRHILQGGANEHDKHNKHNKHNTTALAGLLVSAAAI